MNIVTNGFKNMALFWLENFYLVLKLRKYSVESRNEKCQTNKNRFAAPRIQYNIALKYKGDLILKTDYKDLLTVISKNVEHSTEYLCTFIGEANHDGQYLKIVYDIDFCDNVTIRVNNSWEFLKKVPGLYEVLALELSEDSNFSLLRDCLKKRLSPKVMFSVLIRIPAKTTLVHPVRNVISKNIQPVLLPESILKHLISNKEEIGDSSIRKKPAGLLMESLMARICFWMYLRYVLEENERRSISLRRNCYNNFLRGLDKCNSEFSFEKPQYINHKSRNGSFFAQGKTSGLKDFSSAVFSIPPRIEELVEQVLKILNKVTEKTEYTKSVIPGERTSLQEKEPIKEIVEDNANRDCPYSIDFLKTWNYKQPEVIVSRFADTETEKPHARSKLFGTWTNLTPIDSQSSNGFIYSFNSLYSDDDDEGWSAALSRKIVDFLDDESIVA